MPALQRQHAPTSLSAGAPERVEESPNLAAQELGSQNDLSQDVVSSSNSDALADRATDGPGLATSGNPIISESTEEVLGALGPTDGKKVVVLESSTSTTPVEKARYFKPDTRYSVRLSAGFFKALERPDGPRLVDLCTEKGPCSEDLLAMGGTRLEGTDPQSVTFALNAVNHPNGIGWSSDSVTVEASGNGMLNLARLASAWISIAPGFSDAQKLTIIGKMSLGTKASGPDQESRKENGFTTTAPSFNPTANGTGNDLIAAMAGAMGFAPFVDASALSKPALNVAQAKNSSRAMGEMAERQVNNSWRDKPEDLSFVTSPLTGISDQVISEVTTLLGDKSSAMNTGTSESPDYSPNRVRKTAFGSDEPLESNYWGDGTELNKGIKSKVLGSAKGIAEKLRADILSALPAGMAEKVPESFQSFIPKMLDSWSASINAAFAQIKWDYWYAKHFEKNIPGPGGSGSGSITVNATGSGEGLVHNDRRLMMNEPQP